MDSWISQKAIEIVARRAGGQCVEPTKDERTAVWMIGAHIGDGRIPVRVATDLARRLRLDDWLALVPDQNHHVVAPAKHRHVCGFMLMMFDPVRTELAKSAIAAFTELSGRKDIAISIAKFIVARDPVSPARAAKAYDEYADPRDDFTWNAIDFSNPIVGVRRGPENPMTHAMVGDLERQGRGMGL